MSPNQSLRPERAAAAARSKNTTELIIPRSDFQQLPIRELQSRRTDAAFRVDPSRSGLRTSMAPLKESEPLYQHISKAMRKGWKKKEYLPNPDRMLRDLMRPESIPPALMTTEDFKNDPSSSLSLVKFATKNPRLFAITLLIKQDNIWQVRQAMESFQDTNFTDDCLPLETDLSSSKVCLLGEDDDLSDPRSNQRCKHRREEDAFHASVWGCEGRKDFFQKQWRFLSPKLSEDKFDYILDENVILPFRQNDTARSGSGHFGVIIPVDLQSSHQDAIKTDKPVILVALKEMRAEPGLENETETNWRREVRALAVFNKLRHPHIVRGICAFKQNRKYSILMEWAQQGDLRTLRNKNPYEYRRLTAGHVKQFLQQFRGLADGLYAMHDYKADITGDEYTEETGAADTVQPYIPEIVISDASGLSDARAKTASKITDNWRHGDIKPENILSFDGDKSSGWLGTLKLADLGRARKHTISTAGRDPTSENCSTILYDPPEVSSSPLNKQGRSRFWDIWSYGCVLLESVIWLYFGLDKLNKFLDRDTDRQRSKSLYWSLDWTINPAEINEETLQWLDDMLADPECGNQPGESAMRDIITLIKQKLLVVKLPKNYDVFEEGCRINSRTLVEALDKIILKGKREHYFLRFKERDAAPAKLGTRQKYDSSLMTMVRPFAPDVNESRARAASGITSVLSHAERVDSYAHDFDNEWKYGEDNVFAASMISRLQHYIEKHLLQKDSTLCARCKSLRWLADSHGFEDSLSGLLQKRAAGERCHLCSIIMRRAQRAVKTNPMAIASFDTSLRVDKQIGLSGLIIRRLPARRKDLPCDMDIQSSVQLGFPKILESGSTAHVELIRAWLEDCDQNHERCRPSRACLPPTRIIDVGTLADPSLRLVEAAMLSTAEQESMKYIALSYPWGHPSLHRHFVTNIQNVSHHRHQIPEKCLPQTLADAVRMTRELKLHYLWIDSLCIIQGQGGDFVQEADRMEAVFSSAYCVIAATSAGGSSSGFLQRDRSVQLDLIDPEQDGMGPVYISVHDMNKNLTTRVFVDEPWDDFDGDVLNSSLNQRGWVFQERALARRTIHFAKNQTYWECGNGIRCETLTKIENVRVGFLGDPNFPDCGMQSSKGGDIYFYEDLYEQYSKLSFTDAEDRPFAISALEQRLITALAAKHSGTPGGYWGVFNQYWGHGLLWQRAPDVERLVRLTGGSNGRAPAPSWSWQGHTGAIAFIKRRPHRVNWMAEEVKLPWMRTRSSQSAMTTGSYRGDRGLQGIARDFRTPTNIDEDNGLASLVYDDGNEKGGIGSAKCLIVGWRNLDGHPRNTARNYILLLGKKASATAENVYERVGAGFLDGTLIDFDEKKEISVLVE